ncbi:uncharacterized protein [Nicotiana sylvestris]|uniref:uncharacterized protein n=1 Tax=Nicotiana sylvestris TaxID=4096 RepID=UPI00388C5CD5
MEVTPNEATGNNQTQFFSKEQVSELVNLIKQVQIGGTGNTGTEINANAVAGTILKYSGTCLAAFNTKTWIIDFGDLEHIYNLLSVHKLCVQFSCSLNLTSSACLMQVPLMRRGQVFGEVRDDVKDWHVRLGHLPFQVMKKFNFIHFLSDFDYVCNNTTYNGFKYFLTIVDDYSRGTWTFLLSSKSNAFSALKSFLSLVERQFNKKVKKSRSDNALELGTGTQESSFLLEQGILHETSWVATPQQNGVVERKHRHLLEVARALMFQSNVPLQYWGYKVLDLSNKRMFVSRDVKFHETHFPFLTSTMPSVLPYFPSNPFIPDTSPQVLAPPIITPNLSSSSPSFTPDSYPSSPVVQPAEHNSAFPPHLTPPTPSHNSSPISTYPYTSLPKPVVLIPTPPPAIRKSDRVSKQPAYLQDYVCNSIILSDLTSTCFTHPAQPNVFSLGALSLTNKKLYHSLSTISEPNSFA